MYTLDFTRPQVPGRSFLLDPCKINLALNSCPVAGSACTVIQNLTQTLFGDKSSKSRPRVNPHSDQ